MGSPSIVKPHRRATVRNAARSTLRTKKVDVLGPARRPVDRERHRTAQGVLDAVGIELAHERGQLGEEVH